MTAFSSPALKHPAAVIGAATAGQLMVSAGEKHDRIASEAAFAMLCGVAPIPANSGKNQNNFRLNRGGDRAANAALYRIVLCRLRYDERTRAYVERRTQQGLSKRRIRRCLKRYIARQIYRTLANTTATAKTPQQTPRAA